MFFLCALWLGQWVKQQRGRGRRHCRVLRENGWEEEEQEEAGHRREHGVLRGRCHGGDLSSNCQGGPLGYSWKKRGDDFSNLNAKSLNLASKKRSSF